MNLAAKPATKGAELVSMTGSLVVTSPRYIEQDSLELRRLAREVAMLARVSAAEANLCEINLAAARGDWEEAQRAAANARRLGMSFAADKFEMTAAVNLGYFSIAAPLYRGLARLESGELSSVLKSGLICAAFDDLLHALKLAVEANIVLEPTCDSTAEVAMEASAVLKRLEVGEDDVRAMLDIAGEVMREHRLFWLDKLPRIRVLDSADGAGLLYELRIAVDSKTAGELTEEVLDRLVERDLDRPGIAFSFASSQGLAA